MTPPLRSAPRRGGIGGFWILEASEETTPLLVSKRRALFCYMHWIEGFREKRRILMPHLWNWQKKNPQHSTIPALWKCFGNEERWNKVGSNWRHRRCSEWVSEDVRLLGLMWALSAGKLIQKPSHYAEDRDKWHIHVSRSDICKFSVMLQPESQFGMMY